MYTKILPVCMSVHRVSGYCQQKPEGGYLRIPGTGVLDASKLFELMLAFPLCSTDILHWLLKSLALSLECLT